MNTKITAIIAAMIALVFAGGLALAVNAHIGGGNDGTGQPNQNCQALDCNGPGNSGASNTESAFVDGSTANSHYAGSVDNPTADPNSPAGQHANTDKAVSQYDVACFESATCDC